VDIPLAIEEADYSALLSTLRSLAANLDPAAGDGTLRVVNNGNARLLTCRYKGGLEHATRTGPLVRMVLAFRAFDPYWYAENETAYTFQQAAGVSFFPLLPLSLSSSAVYSVETVANDGDVEAWPVWTITGPGDSLVLRNLTTGETLELQTTILAGQQVTIDTRPGRKTVLRDDGTNLFPYLSDTSSLWALTKGSNKIQVELNLSDANSSVVLRYTLRYLSA